MGRALGLAMLAACQGMEPPPADLLATMASATDGACRRLRGVVEIRSRALSGEFTAHVVAERTRGPRVRLQLFPDIGGKVLDVAASPERIVGALPHGGHFLDGSAAEARSSGELLLAAFAATLLEEQAAFDPARVSGSRASGVAIELHGRAVCVGATVVTVVMPHGEVVERRFVLGRANWTVRGTRVVAPGVELDWRIVDETTLSGPDERAFAPLRRPP